MIVSQSSIFTACTVQFWLLGINLNSRVVLSSTILAGEQVGLWVMSTGGGMKKKPRASSIFSLKCGCRDNRAVSISGDLVGTPPTPLSGRLHSHRLLSGRPESSSADTTTLMTGTTSTSRDDDDDDYDDGNEEITAASPSFSGLLRQLGELERSVVSWAPFSRWGETEEEEKETTHCRPPAAVAAVARGHRRNGRRHRRSISDGGGGGGGGDRTASKVGGFVAVVKQTEDPLGDFRRSMLQMIVEKEILGGEELRDLLHRFLSLNSPAHHALIVQAFADIWRDVFSSYGGEDLLPCPLRRHREPHRDFHYHYRRTR